MTYYLGIDVGAARTSAAVARAGSDDVEPVDLGDGGCGVASVLHLGADGSLDVGEAAERWADDEPDRVVRGFPGRIGDDVPMLLAGEPWAPEELTAWLVRWVVDRVAEREGGPAEAVAVTRPAVVGRRPHRTARRRAGRAGPRRHLPDHGARRRVAFRRVGDGRRGRRSRRRRRVARHSRCGPVAPETRARTTSPRASRHSRSSRAATTGRPRATPDDGLSRPAEVPAPRSHRSGSWPAGRSAAHAAIRQRPEGDPVDGSGAHRAGGSTTTDEPEDALLAALGGFTGTLGATNTAGLLSGYTPPSGLAASGQATALVTEAGEQLALPMQRSGSGRWAAVPDVDEEPTSSNRTQRRHRPPGRSAARRRW